MKKTLIFLSLAFPALLTGCSSESAEETRVTVTSTVAPAVTDAMIETMAISTCFDEINKSSNEAGNEQNSLRWASTPTVDAPNGLNGSAAVEGQAFINTHAGIPWKHEVSCLIAMNGGTPEVRFASAKVPSLHD